MPLGKVVAMKWQAAFLSLVLLFSRPAGAADRTLVAEGDYVALSNPHKSLAHWKVWHLRSGDYEVVETLADPTHIVQVFGFDAGLRPNGFSLTIDTRPTIPKGEKPLFPIYPTVISCQYRPQDLSCENDSNGKKSSLSIAAKQPYVFVPGEFYALDEIWFATGIVRLLEQNQPEDNTVNVYVMENNKIHVGRPIQLTRVGERTAIIMGKPQVVTEYEVWNGREPGEWVLNKLSVLQVTSQRMVASIHGKSDPGFGYAISNYKEYQPWLSPR